MIAVSVLLIPACFFVAECGGSRWGFRPRLDTAVHRHYSKAAPEFFRDYRFLFVGLRWWFKKILGVK